MKMDDEISESKKEFYRESSKLTSSKRKALEEKESKESHEEHTHFTTTTTSTGDNATEITEKGPAATTTNTEEVIPSAWINQTGLIVECNDAFSAILGLSKVKLLRNTYITDLVKLENPHMLLQSIHELNELFNSEYAEGKSSWKAAVARTTTSDDYKIIVEKSPETHRINDQRVLEAVIRLASHFPTPAHHGRSREGSMQKFALEATSAVTAAITDEQRKRVLLVDDSPTALKIMGRIIERQGHEVVMASDGVEALDKLRTEAYDMVLMDIHMPKMNGLEAAHEFRKIEDERNRFYGGFKGKSNLKIIAMSADMSNSLFQEVTNAGFDSFLAKPLTAEKFLELVNNMSTEGKK